ncbi:MAG: GreA/GreB family elongation factor [Bacteroidales bacterium]|nr:GreA/GreB family elongation factor [Bacteroidales bacterium]MDD3891366.1 GreA/GreB family elongation factor [Bacteroidales bacterium]
MSRGFIKEDDQEEIPLVPPRAHLPEGVTNYVTQVGMDELLDERERLTEERDNVSSTSEKERRIAQNHINAKLQLLNSRIAEAKIVDLSEQPQNEVMFGALVTLRIKVSNTIQTFQIVGVDEANVSKGKISFLSPLAQILINKKVGDKAILKLAKENRVFEIMDIAYS